MPIPYPVWKKSRESGTMHSSIRCRQTGMSARGALAESENARDKQNVQGKGRDYALFWKLKSHHQEKP